METLCVHYNHKDKALFYQFQKGNWDEKAKVYSSFKDRVLKHFGRLLIFEENPESLSKEELSDIKKEIAKKLLETNKRPWITIPDCQKKIDDLRTKDETDKKFLNDYDLFVQDLEAYHRKNL